MRMIMIILIIIIIIISIIIINDIVCVFARTRADVLQARLTRRRRNSIQWHGYVAKSRITL